MKNEFYTAFDEERLNGSHRENDYRTTFQIDRDRIIHSSEFRRLQGKTQVFLPGEYDFYRTRLTHSIEVAQIGRSVCNFLNAKSSGKLNESYYIDSDLVEAACLAHDLGHPPFGHNGEKALNKLMYDFGGFEGNAQTLRLITEIFFRADNSRRGLNPTRAFTDSILKYKIPFSKFDKPENHFIYDYQQEIIDWVFGGIALPSDLTEGDALNSFRSIECQIMDWADDTAYAINDLADSISGGFITIEKLESWLKNNSASISQLQIEYAEGIIEAIRNGKYKRKFGAEIGEFINAVSIIERDTFMNEVTNRYKYNLNISNDAMEKAKIYKQISFDIVFRSPQLHQIEFKGNYMINRLFSVLSENYVENILPNKLIADFSDRIIRNESSKALRARLVCDQISGMTDLFATRNYRRLFETDFGSIIDIT